MTRSLPLSRLLPDIVIAQDVEIGGLATDSRSIRPGDVFIAVPGEDGIHGMTFVDDALKRGAVAVLYEPPVSMAIPAHAVAVPGLSHRIAAMADFYYGHASRAMTTVGVTGTNGKTSTVQLLAQAWHALGKAVGSIGTLGAGMHGHMQPTGFTTPPVVSTHRLFGELRDAGATAVAVEVSSHALAQGRVDGVAFDVAAFTNLTRDHLDYHSDMDDYGAAKAKLFKHPGLRIAVINIDDAFGERLATELSPRIRCVTVSAAGRSDARLRAAHSDFDAAGVAFDLMIDGAVHSIRSPLLGRVNVDNLLMVAAILHALDESSASIARILPGLQPIPGRMNRLGGNARMPLVVVDYAHTPDALEQALRSLRAHCRGSLVCVFGCGGERDAGKRPQMAAIAEAEADKVWVTDDNPRNEDGDAIVADIMRGFAFPESVSVMRDRAMAIQAALQQADPGDVVLIAGKGHETYQERCGVKYLFDDSQIAAQALEARR